MRLMDVNFCTESQTTVTASSSDVNFPVSNLKNPFRSKRWRSTDCTSENVVFDLVTTEAIDSVLLLWPKEDGIRLTSGAVIKVQANATNVWTSPAVDQTLTINDDYEIASHYFTTDQNYRYWRILITDASNPWGYIEVGQVWLGKALSIENAENGFKFNLDDKTKVTKTDYGHNYSDELPIFASVEVSYSYIEYEVAQLLEKAFRRNGSKHPVLLALDPEETVFNKDHFVIYGTLPPRHTYQHRFNQYGNVSLVIEESA